MLPKPSYLLPKPPGFLRYLTHLLLKPSSAAGLLRAEMTVLVAGKRAERWASVGTAGASATILGDFRTLGADKILPND